MGSLDIQYANSVTAYGDYAYVNGEPGLLVIDISDPRDPTIVGAFDTTGIGGDIIVNGNYAYMRFGAIINIEDPTAPYVIGRLSGPTYGTGLFISGGRVYFSAISMALTIYDISDPINPVFISEYDPAGGTSAVWVEGSYAFLAYGNYIRIVNVVDIHNPVYIKNAYVPGHARKLCVLDDMAYVTDDSSGLYCVDIDPLYNAAFVGSYDTPGSAYWVCASDKFAYVADRDSGLQIIDCRDPANPVLAASYQTSGPANCVYIYGGYIYLTDTEKFYILRLSQ